jgi:hypothetical protein
LADRLDLDYRGKLKTATIIEELSGCVDECGCHCTGVVICEEFQEAVQVVDVAFPFEDLRFRVAYSIFPELDEEHFGVVHTQFVTCRTGHGDVLAIRALYQEVEITCLALGRGQQTSVTEDQVDTELLGIHHRLDVTEYSVGELIGGGNMV